MKNKILSYLFGCLLIFSMGFMFSYVDAQKATTGEDCGGIKYQEGQYCCDGFVTNVPCDAIVITPKCNGIKLNTDFPIIGDCIELKKTEGGSGANTLNVFPMMVGSLMRIVSSIILVICFIMIIIAGIRRSSNDPKGAKDLIKKVAITILLLGLSGVILKVINPTFFG